MASIIARIGLFVKHRQDLLWRGLVVTLIGWSAYNLGLIQAQKGELPAQSRALIEVRDGAVSQTAETSGQGSGTAKKTTDRSDLRVVVSKSSSSKKYHHAWCSSGTRIKEENRVWFPTAQAARDAGYTLAGNCTE